MKILIVNKFLHPNGGSETYIFRIGEQLEKMGHQIQYFGMEHEGRIVGNRIGCYTSNMDFHTGKMAKLLYPFKIVYSIEAKKKIQRVLEDFQPDIVHINNFNFQMTPSILYGIEKYRRNNNHSLRIIYTAHDSQLVCPNHLMQQYISQQSCTKCIGGSPWNCARYKCIHGSFIKSLIAGFEAWLYRCLKPYRFIDKVICPSAFLKNKLDSRPELREKTVVMHNFVGVDTILEKSRQDNKDYVVYFGRYSKEKGIETLLKVCQKLEHISFYFAGNGPMHDEVKKVANVTDMGFLEGDALQNLIRGASFCIFPSECNENCPFSVMEAIMCGTPVIGADVGGVPELIRNGENGILYESGNESELCDKINKLWNDKVKLSYMKENCLQTKFFGIEEYCEQMIKYYQN